jgi:predicted HTH transcriptional regulator
MEQLVSDKIIVSRPGGRYDITNLGAILFAKDLSRFDRLARKAIRVIKYAGKGKTETEQEWRDPPSQRGYAAGAYEAAVGFINSQSIRKEPIGEAFRGEERMYPQVAIRELVANALVHQDFRVTGAGPVVALFTDRLEITNPGESLVDTLRFINNPPQSRNEELAALMRRMKICEEEGTGIDKVIAAVESAQLPPPDFEATTGSMRAILFAARKLNEMSKAERVRACYQHACLRWVDRERMTNASLRVRFQIDEKNSALASRIIGDTISEGLVKIYDAEAGKRYISYVPVWA